MILFGCCKMRCRYTEMPYYLRRHFSVCKGGTSSAQKHNHALSFFPTLHFNTIYRREVVFHCPVFLGSYIITYFQTLKKTHNTDYNSVSGVSWTLKMPNQTRNEAAQFKCPYLCFVSDFYNQEAEAWPFKYPFCMQPMKQHCPDLVKCSLLNCSKRLKFYFSRFLFYFFFYKAA